MQRQGQHGQGRVGLGQAMLGAPLMLLACAAPDMAARPMPPLDGEGVEMMLGPDHFVVTRSSLASAPNGQVLRVYRAKAKALDYSEGKLAHDVAVAFCGQWNRGLNPAAYGMFEATGAWAYLGGCA